MYSSEALSDRYIHVNNCGRQSLCDSNYNTLRLHGRIDYHILLILSGKCHAEVRGEKIAASPGEAILFRPGEKQQYAFYKNDRSETFWIHFTGVGCKEYLTRLGLYDRSVFYAGSSPALLSVLTSMALFCDLGRLPGNDNAAAAADTEICDGYLSLALAMMAKTASVGEDKVKRLGNITKIAEEMQKTSRKTARFRITPPFAT